MKRITLLLGVLLTLAGCLGNGDYDSRGRERLESLKRGSVPENPALQDAMPGEYWVVDYDSLALLKEPTAPNNKADFMRKAIMILKSGDKVEILEYKWDGSQGVAICWKRVYVYRAGNMIAEGWIRTDNAGKAHRVAEE